MVHTVANVPSNELEAVDIEDSLISAIAEMFEKDYTQLGIEREGEVIGMVSYRSISRVLSILRKLDVEKNLPGRKVGIAIEEVSPVVEPDDDIIVLFELLREDPYVIVDHGQGESLGILTNYDLLQYLRESIEPFLLIEDIERTTREIFIDAIGEELDTELQEFFDEMEGVRRPNGIVDCSFGHYDQFLAHNWPMFDDYFEDESDFVRRLLSEVGDIRNKIFHFRSESYDSQMEEELLKFAHSYFLNRTPA